MRNLKRALSLGLTAAMISGLMVMGSSAASYADVTSENHEEAIAVLQSVGVMVGDENGNFNPDALVTRNEMAVVMSNLMDYRVASYAGTSPFTDVPAWAEPYVAACYTNGITAGYTSTTYGGSDSVTTAQAALMLMKALGYFQNSGDFGSDWQLETIKQAGRIDLFEDVNSAVTEAMTRNELAQLVLNTLESGTVEPSDSNITVSTGDATVEIGSADYEYVVSSSSYARAISSVRGVSSTSISTSGAIVELGEKLYNGDLKKAHTYSADDNSEVDTTNDDFGRPATQWTYGTQEVGTFAVEPDAVYTAKMSKDDLYDLLGKDVRDNYTLYLYQNGALSNVVEDGEDVVLDGKIDSTYAQANSTSASCGSGKGVLTEVYIDSDAKTVTIASITTYLMQATDDYNEDKGSVDVTVLTGNANENALSVDDFDAVTEMAEDDYILYTYAKGKVQTIATAEVVTGDVTGYSNATGKEEGNASGSVSIDGTKYDYAKYAPVDGTNGCATTFSVGDGASIVLDEYGYALYVDDASLAVGSYVYIAAIANQTNLSSTVIADAYFTDGTNETITVKSIKDGATDLTEGLEDDNRLDGANIKGWYSYSKNSKDEYTLKAAQNDKVLESTAIDQGKVSIAGTMSGNSDTIFIVKDKNDNITVYTGIKNVPDITGITKNNSYALPDKDTAGKYASAVFVDASNGTVKNSTSSLLYLLKLDSTNVVEDNEVVYTWQVLLDGEYTTIESKTINSSEMVGNLYENYNTDSDGYYEVDDTDLFDKDDSDHAYAEMDDATITNSGDTLTVAGKSFVVGDDTQIKLVMAPAADSGVLTDIMTDESADYEEMTIRNTSLANKFKNYTVDGEYFVIYDDKDGSDVITTLYVIVTSATKA